MLFVHTIPIVNHELSMYHAPVHAPSRPFFRNVHHRQLQHFQKTVVGWEYGFRFGHLPQLTVEAFDGIRGINQPADGVGKLEISAQIYPVFPPGCSDPGIFLPPDFLKIIQSRQRCRFFCINHSLSCAERSIANKRGKPYNIEDGEQCERNG